MDNLIRILKNVEEKWLNILYEACKKQFQNCHMPSHNEDHHIRVWNYAKILLKQLPQGINIHEENLEQLIIAVFFHDQGMSVTHAKEHGTISRQLCKTFFETNKIIEPAHFNLILHTIENHDQKEYSGNITGINNLLQLLTIADDLDAFGIIGAYRYNEIYLLRKTAIHELPDKVITNLNHRFTYFSDCFNNNKSFVKSQNMRYIAARNFYKDLQMQIKLSGYSPDMKNGPIGVVNYIQNEIINKRLSLKQSITNALSISDDFYFTNFFEKLEKEC